MPNPLHRYQYELLRKMLVESREQARLTQTQVAQRLGKPQSYISKYERGERRLDFTEFLEIADVLAINVIDFINNYRKNSTSL